MNVLAVIPARGGSKGIPRKNIRPLLGRPLVHYSIEAAIAARRVTDVAVSSEDEEILSVASAFSGVALIRRPHHLAEDHASTPPVVLHALEEMEKRRGAPYEIVVLLQPTTPLRTADDIDCALARFEETDADTVVSVVRTPGINPEWMKRMVDDRLVDLDTVLPEMGRRQDSDPIYIRNGAIYAARAPHFKKTVSFKSGVCRPFVMSEATWVNIDTLRDWALAEALLVKRGV